MGQSGSKKGRSLPQKVERAVDDLATLMEREIREALGTGLAAARDKANYKDRVTAAAILTDKVQLLRGQPTERSEVRTLDETDERKRLARAAAEALNHTWKTSDPPETN
jgi:hypothetical protein